MPINSGAWGFWIGRNSRPPTLPPYTDPTARRHVLCQEVGHTLGLHHQSAVTCMNDLEGLLDPAYVSPNAHDYEQLGTIYGSHTDPSSTVVSAPSQGGGQGSGGVSVIVTPDGDGTLFIWIFWAP